MDDQASLRVFISYRREDSAGHAGRLHDSLVHRLDHAAVFMDVGGIEPGVDFDTALTEAVSQCDVMVVILGNHWTTASTAGGTRRLDDPDDYVVAEIALALERDIRVIPLLIDGASMPRAADLPARLLALARRNAMTLNTVSWSRDLEAIVDALERLRPNQPAPVVGVPAPGVPQAAPRLPSAGSEPIAPSRPSPAVRRPIVIVLGLLLLAVPSFLVVKAVASGDGAEPAARAASAGPACYRSLPKSAPDGNVLDLEVGTLNREVTPQAGLERPMVLRFTRDSKVIGALQFTYVRGSQLRRIGTVVEGGSCNPVRGYAVFETRQPSDTYNPFAEMCLPLGGATYRVRFNVIEERNTLILELAEVAC